MSMQDDGQTRALPYHRKSTRLRGHDYTWTRGYFVTIPASTHDPVFEIPELRRILQETWEALPSLFPGITLGEFVIMPDHVHFIIWLDGLAPNAPTLGRVVGAYKSLAVRSWTTYGNEREIHLGGSFWHRGFYDKLIDGQEHLERTRQYIRENPAKLDAREG